MSTESLGDTSRDVNGYEEKMSGGGFRIVAGSGYSTGWLQRNSQHLMLCKFSRLSGNRVTC